MAPLYETWTEQWRAAPALTWENNAADAKQDKMRAWIFQRKISSFAAGIQVGEMLHKLCRNQSPKHMTCSKQKNQTWDERRRTHASKPQICKYYFEKVRKLWKIPKKQQLVPNQSGFLFCGKEIKNKQFRRPQRKYEHAAKRNKSAPDKAKSWIKSNQDLPRHGEHTRSKQSGSRNRPESTRQAFFSKDFHQRGAVPPPKNTQ